MNAAHLHLVFTHLPIVGLLFTIIVHIYGMIRRSEELPGLFLMMYVITGIFGALAYFTGDGAEQILETRFGYAENIIEPHEIWALVFFIGLSVLSVLSAIRIYFLKKTPFDRKCYVVFLSIALLVSILALATGITGGQIRHTENTSITSHPR
ncbi:MAG: hypothetical protein ACM3N9_05065 [Syntrophothermus sp.]